MPRPIAGRVHRTRRRGVTEGTRVELTIGAPNHDPSEFSNLEPLDFTRPKLNSLASGYGLHFCLGAALASGNTSRPIEIVNPESPHTTKNAAFEYRPL